MRTVDLNTLASADCSTAAAPTGTKTWILRSVLSSGLIQLAATPDAEILQIEQEDAGADEQHAKDDDDENAPTLTGAILAWQSGDSLGTVGLLYVILSLILVNGRALGDSTSFTSELTLTYR